jgi:glutaminase
MDQGLPPAGRSGDAEPGDAESARLRSIVERLGGARPPEHALAEALRVRGILSDDPRVAATSAALTGSTPGLSRPPSGLSPDALRPSLDLVERALRDELVIPDFASFASEIREIVEATRPLEGGAVATYIPQLARVPASQYGMALCTIDGQRFAVGDSDVEFTAQSCMKPVNYCIALEELGEESVHATVGREPSGRGFNELTLNSENRPHNPMLNAGAIAICSLIRRQMSLAERFDHVMGFWSDLAGGQRAGFSNAVYLSEKEMGDRNYALGYFMKEKRVFPEGTDLLRTLEFYFQCCAIEATCKRMAVIAATLANGGLCPTTGRRVLRSSTVRNCLSLMYSCGMYDFSGEFAFSIGLPAKSAVSGALMVVVPNVLGLCTWSPRLGALGNSVRGIAFCRELVRRFTFHNYDGLAGSLESKRDPCLRPDAAQHRGRSGSIPPRPGP